MNLRLDAPAPEAVTNAFRRSGGSVRQANGNSPNRGEPLPLWLKARARTLGIRRGDLERMHWRKVWRFMVEA